MGEEWKTGRTGGFGFRKKTAEQAPQKEVASIQSSTLQDSGLKIPYLRWGWRLAPGLGSGGAAWTKSPSPPKLTRSTE